MSGDLPEHVRQFLFQEISRLEKLEIFLLLAEKRERAWNALEVYNQIKTAPQSVQMSLDELAEQKLLVIEQGEPKKYRLASAATVVTMAKEVKEEYAVRRIRVIEVLYTRQNSPETELRNAFRWRKK